MAGPEALADDSPSLVELNIGHLSIASSDVSDSTSDKRSDSDADPVADFERLFFDCFNKAVNDTAEPQMPFTKVNGTDFFVRTDRTIALLKGDFDIHLPLNTVQLLSFSVNDSGERVRRFCRKLPITTYTLDPRLMETVSDCRR